MEFSTRHGIIDVFAKDINHVPSSQSVIIINKRLAITTGCVYNLFSTFPMYKNDVGLSEFIKQLRQFHFISCHNNFENPAVEKFLNTMDYIVSYDKSFFAKNILNVTTNEMKNMNIFTRRKARLLYVYNSPDISRYLHTELCKRKTHPYNPKEFLFSTTFLVLLMRKSKDGSNFSERTINNLIQYAYCRQPSHTWNNVFCMYTPFGFESAFKNIKDGKLLGVRDTKKMILTFSKKLPMGSIGGGVYNNDLDLIGIVIHQQFTVFVVNFQKIIEYFLQQIDGPVMKVNIPKQLATMTWEYSLVAIHGAGNFGIGTFINFDNESYIITSSHIILPMKDSDIRCQSVDGEFFSKVLWVNNSRDNIFDIAILSVPRKIPFKYCAGISQYLPKINDKIYNANFAYDPDNYMNQPFQLKVYKGHIIRTSWKVIVSNSCIRIKQNGGPMFDKWGRLLGIRFLNLQKGGDVATYINCAVPINNILYILDQYIQTNNVNIMNQNLTYQN